MLEVFPSQALFGGILIGISAALLLAFNGRIAGISGILYNLLFNPLSGAERGWRIAFLMGLVYIYYKKNLYLNQEQVVLNH